MGEPVTAAVLAAAARHVTGSIAVTGAEVRMMAMEITDLRRQLADAQAARERARDEADRERLARRDRDEWLRAIHAHVRGHHGLPNWDGHPAGLAVAVHAALDAALARATTAEQSLVNMRVALEWETQENDELEKRAEKAEQDAARLREALQRLVDTYEGKATSIEIFEWVGIARAALAPEPRHAVR